MKIFMLAENSQFHHLFIVCQIFFCGSADGRLFATYSAIFSGPFLAENQPSEMAFAPANIIAVLMPAGSIVQIIAQYVNCCTAAILLAVMKTSHKCFGSHGENIL